MEIVRAAVIGPAAARVNDFGELAKPRITFLVVLTAAVGYAVGPGHFDAPVFFALVLGTALLSGGASALNQYREADTDALMDRTRNRPVPAGRMAPADARTFGLVLCGFGAVLLAAANPLSAALGLAALGIYVLVYTPMKRRSSLCTVVGAVPGALPPLMGWAASRGTLDAGGWALFAVLFLWQLPHFLAIGWMYRDDYARGGFPMLTVTDRDGSSTGRQMVLYSAALIPATLFAGALCSSGRGYLWSALALGLAFLGCSVRFALTKSRGAARTLFLVSILYLPILLGLMVFDR